MTSFIGRRREIDDARFRLQQSRLVSVVGPGGVGKSRLAEEVATRSSRAFQGSCRWIDLASARDPDALLSTAAAALGVTDQSNRPVMDKIVEHLDGRSVLIVLDNCEHLLSAAAEFAAEILAGDPNVHILATSREPLGIGGEVVYTLAPLNTPDLSPTYRAQDIAPYESVTLLVERAQAVVTGFQLTDANAAAVAHLCNRLDGIPLAIELAAARLRSLAPAQLVERLDRRFALLTGGDRAAVPRQQTLRALIDWSYELCSDSERLLWSRLSVFPGSFDLEAAEIVCSDDSLPTTHLIDVLDALISKSLVTVQYRDEIARYSQLVTVREYGHELLEDRGECEVIHRRHRNHYLDRAQRSVADWYGPHQSQLLARLRLDHPHLIAAFDNALIEEDLTAAADIAVALRYHWIAGGNLADGRVRLERLLLQPGLSGRARGDVLWVTAWTALIQGDRDDARRHLDECATIASTLGDRRLQAHYEHWAGLHALFCGRTAEAIDLFARAITGHRAAGDFAAVLTASFQLAMAETYDGRLDDALATCAGVVEIADRHGERWNKAYALWVSSVACFHLGRTESAVGATRQALDIQREFKDRICTALSIEVLAWAAESGGRLEQSASLFGAAGAVWQRLGTSVAAFGPHIEGTSSTSRARLAGALGEKTFIRLSTPPAGLSIDQAVALALGGPREEAASVSTTTSPLTRREQEVAELLATGLSNREIAEALVISPRTVDGHVERILDKLGVGSRTQVATWVAALPAKTTAAEQTRQSGSLRP